MKSIKCSDCHRSEEPRMLYKLHDGIIVSSDFSFEYDLGNKVFPDRNEDIHENQLLLTFNLLNDIL